jgi:hypothetical protein
MEIPIKLSPEEFSSKYQGVYNLKKGGSLCFWGHWFGRPYDNFHEIISVEFETNTDLLILKFSEMEVLTITNPGNISEFLNRIEIQTADRVHWQWFDYGKEKTMKNLYTIDFVKIGNKIIGKSSIHWSAINIGDLSVTKPAVLMVGL